MADNLIFPIKFDLERGVIEAGKDADRYLRQLENTLRQKPIQLDVTIDKAAPGSIDAISKRMSALSQEFNKLTEVQRVYNRTSGEFTTEAQKIIKEYAELTAATQTYAQSLSQITAAAKRQTQEQMKAQEQEIKRYEEYWKRKETENAKQAQQEIANAERSRKAQQQRISQEQAADAKRYQEWLRQKNQEAVETERVERQKQQSRERTIAQQNREFAAQRQAEQQRQQAISASLRAEYQRIEAKKQAEAALRRELQMLNQQYAAEERRQRVAASQASVAKRQQVIKTLRAEENTIVNITAKLQHWQQVMNSSAMDGRQFRRATEEVQRLSQKLSDAQARISQLTATTSNASARQAAAHRQVTSELGNQSTYLSRLIQRMAVYASFSYAGNFLTSVREVTAQFELQRVSLGAIIQDTSRANQLWSEIKTFALKSPVKIIDLTKYTKQVAAYGVETDKLFDTTKRIMDISVGLGVDASRLVLAYGQVKAASYLRAAEIRQFTEAGIPMLELLAEKFTELNGKAVTTEQVMDMVSKRMVGFDMVEQIFKDMTSAGGMFFDMQEKQGNTLYGLWAKMGDAASIMYDEIGNTSSINAIMKGSIQLLTDLMKNWRLVAGEIAVAGVAIGFIVAKNKAHTAATALQTAALNKVKAAGIAYNAVLAEEARLQKIGTAAQLQSVAARKANAKAALDAAIAEKAAATSTSMWTRSMQKLKAVLMGNWITLLIAGIAAIGTAIYDVVRKANKLKNELKEIGDAGRAEAAKNVFNFERLANAALNAATGSREQKEALDELKRTYRDIIPSEQLSLVNLKKMREQGYEPLTAAIKEYIAQRTLQKEIDAITSHYTEDTIAKQRELRELFRRGSIFSFFKGVAWSPIESLDDDQISQVFANVDKIAKDKYKSWEDVWVEAIKGVTDVSEDAEKRMRKMFVNQAQNAQQQSYNNKMRDIVENMRNMADETDTATKKMEDQTGSLGKYKQVLDETTKSLSNLRLVSNGKEVDPSSFLGKRMSDNAHIKAWKDDIVANLQDAGIAIKKEWFNIITNLNPKGPSQISSINFDPILDAVDDAADKLGKNHVHLRNSIAKYKELYDGIVPSDRTVASLRNKLEQLSGQTDASMDDMQRHLMKSGESWADYSKRIEDEIRTYKDSIAQMEKSNKAVESGENAVLKFYSEEEIAKANTEMETLIALLDYLKKSESEGDGGSDPRLGILQEMASTLKQVNKEYEELAKKEGAAKALADTQDKYANTFKYMKSLTTEYNFELPDFGVPTDAVSLATYLDAIKEAMKKLQKYEKAVLSGETDIADINMAYAQKKIESELKRLADRISRTKTAKEFYEKILGMTGDVELAANVAIHVYREQGKDLNKQIREQIEKLLEPSGIKIDESIFRADDTFDPKKLREFAEAQKDALGGIESKAYQELIKLSDNAEKDFAKTIEGWLKAIEKAKSASDKMLDLARTTRTEIDKITAQKGYAQTRITELLGLSTRTDEQQQELENLQGFLDVADKLIQGFKDKQAKEQTSLAYEMFKDSPMYVQMFDDLDHASTAMLENMKTRIEGLKGAWKDLTPTQLKELQSRMNEIDAQLAKRNPFKTLAKSISDYRKLRREGDSRGNKSEGAANADLIAASKAADEARKKYDELVKKYGEGSEKSVQEVIDAKDKLDRAMANEEAAQKAVENWKKVKDMIGLSANELFQMLNWAGDISKGIADISEAMGADEEDVQYWNDVADAFGQISGGIQDIVSAAMSGDVVGIISSVITAIPKMFVGITKLFHIGKIRKANKEIKRQQELLDQLEYTYARLEKSAERLFGKEYLENYNQQLEVLRAQAEAYRKQAEAEERKGKEKDKEKIKEHEEAARETADKIQELQDDLFNRITGTDVASAARDFAQSWLDAYLSFGSTTNAIKEKFQEMIKNMVVSQALAGIVQRALQPIFDEIENRAKDGNLSSKDIADVMAKIPAYVEQIDNGMRVGMEGLKAAGLDISSLRDATSEYSGIAKNIAGATSEEINTAAAIGNTLMYYVSPIPRMDENLSAIRALMERGMSSEIPATASASAGWTDWQKQAMDNYIAIQRNTAETVTECRRIAERCTAMASDIHKVIVPRGVKGSHGVQIYM